MLNSDTTVQGMAVKTAYKSTVRQQNLETRARHA
jgi:hypothetical protein